MLVVSTTAFRLMGMCLTLYSSAAFASPVAIDFTPKPQGFTPKPLRGLERRRPADDDNLCSPKINWVARRCVPERGPPVWQDNCRTPEGVVSAPLGNCLPTERCQDDLDNDDDPTIICVNILEPGKTQARVQPRDPQIGASSLQYAPPTKQTSQFQFDVTIEDNLGFSMVGAAVLSKDRTFLLETANIIVGKIKGREITACSGDHGDLSKARECYPRNVVNLYKGNVIAFTWGLSTEQEASLQYAIIPQS